MPIQFQNFTPLVQPHYTMAETQTEKDAENARKAALIGLQQAGETSRAIMDNNTRAGIADANNGLQREANAANMNQQGIANDQAQQRINAGIENNNATNERQAAMDKATISNQGLQREYQNKTLDNTIAQQGVENKRNAEIDANRQTQLGLTNKRQDALDARTQEENKRADVEYNQKQVLKNIFDTHAAIGNAILTGQSNKDGYIDITSATDALKTGGQKANIVEGAKVFTKPNAMGGGDLFQVGKDEAMYPVYSGDDTTTPISLSSGYIKLSTTAANTQNGTSTKKVHSVEMTKTKDENGLEVSQPSSITYDNGDTSVYPDYKSKTIEADSYAQKLKETNSAQANEAKVKSGVGADANQMAQASSNVDNSNLINEPRRQGLQSNEVAKPAPQKTPVPANSGYTQEQFDALPDRVKTAVINQARRGSINSFAAGLEGKGKILHQ